MKFEIIDKTLVIRMNWLPRGIKFINLCGVLLCRYTTQINSLDWQHEAIHSQQWYETLIIGMLLWYPIEFFIRLFKYGNWDDAYKNVSFESEAYGNEFVHGYIQDRKHFAWLDYL